MHYVNNSRRTMLDCKVLVLDVGLGIANNILPYFAKPAIRRGARDCMETISRYQSTISGDTRNGGIKSSIPPIHFFQTARIVSLLHALFHDSFSINEVMAVVAVVSASDTQIRSDGCHTSSQQVHGVTAAIG